MCTFLPHERDVEVVRTGLDGCCLHALYPSRHYSKSARAISDSAQKLSVSFTGSACHPCTAIKCQGRQYCQG